MTPSRLWVVAVLALLVASSASRDAGAQRLNPMIALLEAGERVPSRGRGALRVAGSEKSCLAKRSFARIAVR